MAVKSIYTEGISKDFGVCFETGRYIILADHIQPVFYCRRWSVTNRSTSTPLSSNSYFWVINYRIYSFAIGSQMPLFKLFLLV